MVWLGIAGALVNSHGTILLIDPLLCPVERDGKLYNEGVLEMIVPLPIVARAIQRVWSACSTPRRIMTIWGG
jgi:hypothetical protein